MPGLESLFLLVGTSATVVTASLPDDLSGIAIESLEGSATTVDAVPPVLEVPASRVSPICRRQITCRKRRCPPSVEDRRHA